MDCVGQEIVFDFKVQQRGANGVFVPFGTIAEAPVEDVGGLVEERFDVERPESSVRVLSREFELGTESQDIGLQSVGQVIVGWRLRRLEWGVVLSKLGNDQLPGGIIPGKRLTSRLYTRRGLLDCRRKLPVQ